MCTFVIDGYLCVSSVVDSFGVSGLWGIWARQESIDPTTRKSNASLMNANPMAASFLCCDSPRSAVCDTCHADHLCRSLLLDHRELPYWRRFVVVIRQILLCRGHVIVDTCRRGGINFARTRERKVVIAKLHCSTCVHDACHRSQVPSIPYTGNRLDDLKGAPNQL